MAKIASVRVVLLLAALLLVGGCGDAGSEKATQPAQYEVKPYTGWPPVAEEEKIGAYIENSWYDPAKKDIIFAVFSRASEEAGSPTANAELARLQASNLSDYRERAFKRVRLEGRQVELLAFDAGGESHVEFFFEECDTSFVVRGTALPIAYEALSESFRTMAATIEVPDCDE